MAKPRRILFSAQKNEGPFILEWVAYHKVVGFTDIVIVSNDCTDGSDDLLDTLAAAGEITHIRQSVPEGKAPQLNAAAIFLDSGYLTPGDWVMWLDIDEYLVVHGGEGTVGDLLSALPGADAVAVAWRIFGDSDRPWAGRQVSSAYSRASPRSFFPNSQVKTLFRYDERILGMELHRPILSDDATPETYSFRHSGGGRVPDLFFDHVFDTGAPAHRLVGVKARYRLAQVNHYTLRSRAMFEAKKARGNGYVPRGDVTSIHFAHQDEEYFAKYNRNETEDRTILKAAGRTFRETDRLWASVVPAKDKGGDAPDIAVWWNRDASGFGGGIGPWLVSAITGRKVHFAEPDAPNTLLTAGSTLSEAPKGGSVVWGSGCPSPLDDELRSKLVEGLPFDVRALRGKLTLDIVQQVTGKDMPQVLGDPALLLPLFLPPPDRGHGDVLICPHAAHRDAFPSAIQHGMRLVDASKNLSGILCDIAGAQACISTSLDGCIMAQAYGVPWVWLRISDRQTPENLFIFEDFFSTLDRGQVAEATLASEDLSTSAFEKLSQQARLPVLEADLDRLLEAFPFDVAALPLVN